MVNGVIGKVIQLVPRAVGREDKQRLELLQTLLQLMVEMGVVDHHLIPKTVTLLNALVCCLLL